MLLTNLKLGNNSSAVRGSANQKIKVKDTFTNYYLLLNFHFKYIIIYFFLK